ncbi:hypothetical protein [Streptomyces katsurahamanus]|uniref:Spore-associated protein A n=1 Tax=Streptomyces katsurahamanus TaxID=2577098 RepID=A0ABW9NT59_9ACTN|nr:hypothetical protein [Streptomyces katsurahamanus]MQS36466.1 hypothetical protein [Streptomyces katsurahamanus]
MRKLVSVLAGGALAAAGLVGVAPTASAAPAAVAAYGCTGNLVQTTPVTGAGTDVWANFQLYYTTTGGGTYCGVLVAKKYAGQQHYLELSMDTKPSAGGCNSTSPHDCGMYLQYAGPVKVTNAKDKCLAWNARVDAPNGASAVTGASCD